MNEPVEASGPNMKSKSKNTDKSLGDTQRFHQVFLADLDSARYSLLHKIRKTEKKIEKVCGPRAASLHRREIERGRMPMQLIERYRDKSRSIDIMKRGGKVQTLIVKHDRFADKRKAKGVEDRKAKHTNGRHKVEATTPRQFDVDVKAIDKPADADLFDSTPFDYWTESSRYANDPSEARHNLESARQPALACLISTTFQRRKSSMATFVSLLKVACGSQLITRAGSSDALISSLNDSKISAFLAIKYCKNPARIEAVKQAIIRRCMATFDKVICFKLDSKRQVEKNFGGEKKPQKA